MNALTPRETEVLESLVAGLTYAEAEKRLGMAKGTLNTHVLSIYKKLGVKSRNQAAAMVITTLRVELETLRYLCKKRRKTARPAANNNA